MIGAAETIRGFVSRIVWARIHGIGLASKARIPRPATMRLTLDTGQDFEETLAIRPHLVRRTVGIVLSNDDHSSRLSNCAVYIIAIQPTPYHYLPTRLSPEPFILNPGERRVLDVAWYDEGRQGVSGSRDIVLATAHSDTPDYNPHLDAGEYVLTVEAKCGL